MATTTGPLMSMEASGTIGKTLTFARWKGRAYVRTRVIPHNPKTQSQYSTRAMMRFLTQQWTAVPIVDTTWKGLAEATKISAFNAFVQLNMRNWTQFLFPTQTNPPARSTSGVVIPSMTGNAGVGQITGDVTLGTNTNSWGVAIFLDLGGAWNPDRNNCRLILPGGSAAVVPYTLTAVAPGTYDVTAINFNTDGAAGPNISLVGPIVVT